MSALNRIVAQARRALTGSRRHDRSHPDRSPRRGGDDLGGLGRKLGRLVRGRNGGGRRSGRRLP